jgi:5-methylcytosine-specific restriction protein A
MRADAETIRKTLEECYGVCLSMEERPSAEGQKIVLWPSDLPESRGVPLEILLGWRSLDVCASGGSYSRDLIAAMSSAEPRQRETFRSFLRTATTKGGTILLAINGKSCDFEDESIWNERWLRLSLQIGIHPLTGGGISGPDVCSSIIPWVSLALGAVLSLVPLEEDDESARREGAIREILGKRYERDPINRVICLEIHGTSCKACGFDFYKAYGEIGKDFIEVHHVDQLADNAGTEVVINPLTDLTPLCSNCHSMVHRRKPPYLVDELRNLMKSHNHSTDTPESENSFG